VRVERLAPPGARAVPSMCPSKRHDNFCRGWRNGVAEGWRGGGGVATRHGADASHAAGGGRPVTRRRAEAEARADNGRAGRGRAMRRSAMTAAARPTCSRAGCTRRGCPWAFGVGELLAQDDGIDARRRLAAPEMQDVVGDPAASFIAEREVHSAHEEREFVKERSDHDRVEVGAREDRRVWRESHRDLAAPTVAQLRDRLDVYAARVRDVPAVTLAREPRRQRRAEPSDLHGFQRCSGRWEHPPSKALDTRIGSVEMDGCAP